MKKATLLCSAATLLSVVALFILTEPIAYATSSDPPPPPTISQPGQTVFYRGTVTGTVGGHSFSIGAWLVLLVNTSNPQRPVELFLESDGTPFGDTAEGILWFATNSGFFGPPGISIQSTALVTSRADVQHNTLTVNASPDQQSPMNSYYFTYASPNTGAVPFYTVLVVQSGSVGTVFDINSQTASTTIDLIGKTYMGPDDGPINYKATFTGSCTTCTGAPSDQQTATAVAQQTIATQQTAAAQTAIAAAQQTAASGTATAAAQQTSAVQTATAAAQQTSAAQTVAASTQQAAASEAQQTAAAAQQAVATQQAATAQTATAAAQEAAVAHSNTIQQPTPTAISSNSKAVPLPSSTDTSGGNVLTLEGGSPSPARVSHKSSLQLALTLLSSSVASGSTLTVNLHTASRAHVTFLLQVVTTKVVVTGKGKHRKRVAHTVVLYRIAGGGTTDSHGRLTAHLRITYNTAKTVQSTLTITVRTAHGSVKRATRIAIQPTRHKARHKR